jgi:hypothetical protein
MLAKAVQLLKGGSSKWLNESLKARFEWQEGYGAFSISVSHREQVIEYINSQAEHHQRRNFEQEFVALLEKHYIDFEPIRVGVRAVVPTGLRAIGPPPQALQAPGYWQMFLRNTQVRL